MDMPVNVFWVSKCLYDESCSVEPHVHTFYHMIFALQAIDAEINIQGESYHPSMCEIFIVPPNTLHYMKVHKQGILNTIEVKFSALNQELSYLLISLKKHFTTNITRLPIMFEELIYEASFSKYLYRDVINARFLMILFYLMRSRLDLSIPKSTLVVEDNLIETNDTIQKLSSALDFIRNNIGSPITIQMLCEASMMSTTQLNKSFHVAFNTSPMKYVHLQRIKLAKNLLRNTDLSVGEISAQTGYQSIHYFSRYFKQAENMSPVEYRRKLSKNVYIVLDDISPDGEVSHPSRL